MMGQSRQSRALLNRSPDIVHLPDVPNLFRGGHLLP